MSLGTFMSLMFLLEYICTVAATLAGTVVAAFCVVWLVEDIRKIRDRL